MGRDEFAAAYSKWSVQSCQFRIDFASNGGVPMTVGWAIHRGSTGTTAERYIESGDVKYTTLGDNDAGSGVKSLTGSVDVPNWLGVSSRDDNIQGSAADPTTIVYLHVFARAIDTASDPAALKCSATLDYNTTWFEKVILPSS